MPGHGSQETLTRKEYGNIEPAEPTTAPEIQIDKELQAGVGCIQEPITYHYLTFETIPPCPSDFSSGTDNLPTLEPPDLTHFVSPFNWPASRKHTIIFLSCMATVLVSYAAGSYDAAAEQISKKWNVSQTTSYLGITTCTIGFAIAFMMLAPFSELNGRRPVFVVTGVLFVVGHLACALTPSFAGLLVARFFVGVGGSTFSVTLGGVISDIYHQEDRNTPMAFFADMALFGTGLGPLVSGFVAQNLNWRWIFWVQVITCGICILAVIIFFKETRGSVILSRKAALLNRWYQARENAEAELVGFRMPLDESGSKSKSQRIRWKVKSDEERKTLSKMLGISLFRPFCKYRLFSSR